MYIYICILYEYIYIYNIYNIVYIIYIYIYTHNTHTFLSKIRLLVWAYLLIQFSYGELTADCNIVIYNSGHLGYFFLISSVLLPVQI